jgi:hypothetical protein
MTPPGSSPVVGPAGKDGDVAGRRSTIDTHERPCGTVMVPP